MYVQFVHLALRNQGVGVELVYEGTCCLALFLTEGEIGAPVVCVFSIFNAGGSVCGCMCVCTNTHTTHMGYSVVSPGVGIRHLEGLKNPDGLNLGICVSYMWSKYTCVCICMCTHIFICLYIVYTYIYMSLYRMYAQFVSFGIGE